MSPVPELNLRAPARRATDVYVAVGFFGTHLIGAGLALVVLIVPEPNYTWHAYLAAVLFVASFVPLVATIGIFRHVYRTRERARLAHNERVTQAGGGGVHRLRAEKK